MVENIIPDNMLTGEAMKVQISPGQIFLLLPYIYERAQRSSLSVRSNTDNSTITTLETLTLLLISNLDSSNLIVFFFSKTFWIKSTNDKNSIFFDGILHRSCVHFNFYTHEKIPLKPH